MVATDPSDVLSTLIQRESVLYAVDVAGCEKRDIVAAVPSRGRQSTGASASWKPPAL